MEVHKKTIIITGGTGMIGRALTRVLLKKGYSIIILTRKLPQHSANGKADSSGMQEADNIRYALWDIEKQKIDKNAIASADFIIHLAGAGVAEKRWTKKRKQEIVESRTKSGKLIADSLNSIPNNVKAVVSASAIGWYGPERIMPSGISKNKTVKGARKFEETDPPANDFLGSTCRQWEDSMNPVQHAGRRLVTLRTGIVLSKDGGALKEFLKPLRFGIAAILGSGKQVISWIHIDDLVRMYIDAIENNDRKGIYNAVAPYPVSNEDLTLVLARLKKGRFFTAVHIPAFLLKLFLGEMSVEVLKSATVSCSKIQMEGFVFEFPQLQEALADII